MHLKTLSRNAKRAIKKYGEPLCIEAYRKNERIGLGANTIACETPGLPNTNAADAAINAGRELMKSGYNPFPIYFPTKK